MRLIDADKFKKQYCKESCGERQCVDNSDRCVFILSLNEQPTAYNLEKIVEQLEKYPHGEYVNVETMSEIIEIVRKGGKE